MNYKVGIAAGLVSYYLFAWIASTLFGLTGVDLWVVRGFLALFGLSGAGLVWWYMSRRKRKAADAQGGEAGGMGDEVDLIVRDAEARLAASNVTKGAKAANLPVIFLIGPPGSAKTNSLVHSGLEPELLAGQVYQDNSVLPTRSANLWFSRQTVFAEAGGSLLAQPPRWMRLVRKMEPRRLATALGKGEQAPRAAVVCFDVEEFMKPGARDSVAAAARNLHARLGEISQLLGISFPVYVLFTKADRLPFFLEYVRNLGKEEATQVVGATLPIVQSTGQGVYAEQASQRLGAAFDELFRSFCDKRVEYLSRENAPDKLPGIYEFPREFRKLRASLVQFLVDLCKPSQLRAAPFLRGFYFSGVRPIVVDEIAAPVAPRPVMERQGFEPAGSATGIFKHGMRAPEALVQQPRVTGTKRVPQWVFLTHFWNDVVLADRDAISASGASVKTSALRRTLFIAAASLCVLYSIALTVSWVRNRNLEARVIEAAKGISVIPVSGQEVASLDGLKRLEALRQELATLSDYERNGAPLSMRWGLYTGDQLYPDTYRLYFSRYHALLFGWTQASMLDSLRRLPASPTPTDPYSPPYNTLKAYLITTSEWKRSTRAFLSPYLANRWSEGRNIDAERLALAQKQFDFYSEELSFRNPFSAQGDAAALQRARQYLKQFNADERIYQALVEEASKRTQSINFNRMFPNESVSDPREVRGAFTRDGWAFMQEAFKKPDSMFGGEDWVLGPQSFANVDRAQLESKLRGFYQRDFVEQWRAFLREARVAPYQNLSDAAKKLALTSSNQSPLLALMCIVAQHTSVDVPEVKNAFQAPQQVVPPACQTQYVGPSNQNYMSSLLRLQNSVQQVAQNNLGPSDPMAGQTLAQANEARFVTQQIAQTFGVDKEGRIPDTVRKLMEDPITEVERILKGMGPAELRAKGAGLCGQFNALMAKYPFNLKATDRATIEDVNRFFRPPDGLLWKFYTESLQPLVQKEGGRYVPKAGGTMNVTPGFLNFFNRAAGFAEAAYPAGAQQPKINYTLKSDLTGSNQSLSLTLDGQAFTNGGGKMASKQFTWPGSPAGARMQVKFGGDAFNWPPYEGLWAAFEFFGDSEEKSPPSGSIYRLEWTLRTGQSQRAVTTSTGQPVSVRFDLDMMGSPPIFRKGYFSGWGCTADVAR
jgi:type VI secretion system protein ImpL